MTLVLALSGILFGVVAYLMNKNILNLMINKPVAWLSVLLVLATAGIATVAYSGNGALTSIMWALAACGGYWVASWKWNRVFK